ncbi:uncharacterized protein TRAVEDRAFT_141217 [Trametes versicolor FP-101664 SS1]|uniref:uncharacterized protein n=1 Tax=Trametes versicolor (strain FP-101664) TaxID=717944 RepID=UPI0004621B47|nr:uncharacterized protein TRAVEDRAFT_141217 [Trametes versicolor FP-101664 SS1]EIW62704.1 hypothetical protein TRAVEDRAFT_141217 [Trametes versicolor FP-101664 SS1]
MTTFGMPFFLEDTTGRVTGSEFVDLHNRMHLSLKQTLNDATHSAYVIYDLSSRASGAGRGGYLLPLATLDFPASNALGTIKIGDGAHVPMGDYLAKSGRCVSRARKFRASDGQDYRWTLQANGEWQCVNARSGYHIATYSMKPAGEPQYSGSSGCMLTVEEAYPHLVGELLASLIIMRYIEQHNL